MNRKVISVIYPVFVYKTVIANCCWSLVRFDEKSLTESFIECVNITPVLYSVLPKHKTFYSTFFRNMMQGRASAEAVYINRRHSRKAHSKLIGKVTHFLCNLNSLIFKVKVNEQSFHCFAYKLGYNVVIKWLLYMVWQTALKVERYYIFKVSLV